MADADDAVPAGESVGAGVLGNEPLFYEPGATWYWVLAGPAAGVAMLLIELWGGVGPRPLVPLVFAVLVSGFVALQVKAARIHTSVELTEKTLRQGAQIVEVDGIVGVYPEPENLVRSVRARTENRIEKWQSARALGELSGLPRGRTAIGIRLTGGRDAQAWARKHRALRGALTALVGPYVGPADGPAL